MTLASKPAVYTGYNSTLGKRVRPGYAQAARVRALGPSRANPWAPRRRRVTVSLENEGDSGLGCSDHHDGGGGRGPSRTHRFYVSLSYAALRTKRTPGRGVNKQHHIFYAWRGTYRRYGTVGKYRRYLR